MPVNYVHSEKSVSALAIATSKGFETVVNKLIELGAVPANANDVTMADLSQQEINVSATNPADAIEAEHARAMQQFLSTAYQMTSHTDDIDHKLLLTTIKCIHTSQPYDGSILVFLPGYDDIMVQKDLIESQFTEMDYQLFVLHSNAQGTSQSDKRRVFYRMPHGIRKIILSTNISETSLTIEDVVYVVDAGKVKQTTYDSLSETTCLTSTAISQACAKQRAGRAGRTRAGICYRLYSIEQYENMDKFTLPELLRVPLTDICLNAKILGPGIPIEEFLLKALQPPPLMSIRQSINLLKRIDALDPDENVTELGVHLADFPVDAQLAKCLLYAVIFRCIDPVVTIISALSVKDPFLLPFNNERKEIDDFKKILARDTFSDHMVLLNVYIEWNNQKNSKREKTFCYRNNISNSTMEMISGVRSLIMRHLNDAGLSSDNILNFNEYSGKWCVIKACLAAGLYPNQCHFNGTKLVSKQDRKLMPHRSSILRKHNHQIDPDLKNSGLDWLIHGEKSKPSYVAVIRNLSPVSSMSIALFSGHINLPISCIEIIQDNVPDSDEDSDIEHHDSYDHGKSVDPSVFFCLDDWVVFHTSHHNANSVYRIRCKFNAILMKMLKNTRFFVPTLADTNVIAALVLILEFEEYGECTFMTPEPIARSTRNALNSRQYFNAVNSPPRGGSKSRQNSRSGFKNATMLSTNRNKRMPSGSATHAPSNQPNAGITLAALQQAVNQAEEQAKHLDPVAGSSNNDYTLPSIDIVFNAIKSEAKMTSGGRGSRGLSDGQHAVVAVSSTSTPTNSLLTFRPKQSFTMITREMAAETNSFKYFLLTIPTFKKLFATIFASNKWHFGMAMNALQKCKEVSGESLSQIRNADVE